MSAHLERPQALKVINALRQGSNVLDGAGLFSAGRETIVAAAQVLLEELTTCDMSAVRWLRGDYGSGKTHMFARVREAAQNRNWVTSYVVVSGRGQGCELHRFHEVYSSIVRNCVLPNAADSDGPRDGWAEILDDWVEALKRQAGARPGGDVPSFKVADALRGTMAGLAGRHGIHGSYAGALKGYASARLDGDLDSCGILLEWFAGTDVLKQSAAIKARLKSLGVLEAVSQRNAKTMLRQMTGFLRYRGLSGLLVLFDEVENVLQMPPTSRRASYTLVRELIDNVDAVNGMTRTLLYFSGTPDLFDSDKGVIEYEALASRIMVSRGGGPPNPAAAVVDLEAFPITKDDLVTVASKIASIYASAYPNKRPSDIRPIIDGRLGRPPYPSPRIWVKSVVDELDRSEGVA